jgi:hypothetical protein
MIEYWTVGDFSGIISADNCYAMGFEVKNSQSHCNRS